MFISRQQLAQFLEIDCESSRLIEALEAMGHEVEERIDWPALDAHALAATITARRAHPEREDLHCYELLADGESFPMVSALAGLREGMTLAIVSAGGSLGGEAVAERRFGAELSRARLASAADLGLAHPELMAHESGVLRLHGDGQTGALNKILSLPDSLIDVRPTPNRGDCLSVHGIARELAARLGLAWRQPLWSPACAQEQARQAREALQGIAPGELAFGQMQRCAYYALASLRLGSERDWSAEPSPIWMQESLRRLGQRPLSLLVDMSNYFQFIHGQPMHIFDADRIDGKVSVRASVDGESFSTLDHRQLDLRPGSLLVADDSRAIAMAGVYGGDGAEIGSQTTTVAIECACFDADAIRGIPRHYGLHTESALRYERGVDPGLGERALAEFIALAQRLIPGAEPVGLAVHQREISPRQIDLSAAKAQSYLGFSPPAQEAKATLTALGFAVAGNGGDSLSCTAPSWRDDVSEDVCLIEELLRMGLLESIPQIPGHSGADHENRDIEADTRAWQRAQQARRDLISAGFSEVCGYAFANAEDERLFCQAHDDRSDTCYGIERPPRFVTPYTCSSGEESATDSGAATLVNPISTDMDALRRSLIPGLCQLLLFHCKRQYSDLRLFETGSVYARQRQGIAQTAAVAGLVFGRAFPEQWGHDGRGADFYDILGLVEGHLRRFVPNIDVAHRPSRQTHLHPGRAVDLLIDGSPYGYVGQLHPALQRRLELAGEALVFEYDSAIYQLARSVHRAELYSTSPHIRRDFSFLVPQEVSASRLLAETQAFGLPHLQKSAIFDIYRGKSLESGFNSVSLLLIFGEKHTNLLETEIDASCRELVEFLRERLGVSLRT